MDPKLRIHNFDGDPDETIRIHILDPVLDPPFSGLLCPFLEASGPLFGSVPPPERKTDLRQASQHHDRPQQAAPRRRNAPGNRWDKLGT